MEELRNAGGEIIDPARDRPGLVVRALVGATAAGTTVVALALHSVRALLANAPASDQAVVTGPAFFIVVGGTFGAVALAVVLAWRALAPLTSSWRRGVFGMVAGFGTVIAALGAAPIHQAWGRGGLLIMAGIAAIVALPLLASTRRP